MKANFIFSTLFCLIAFSAVPTAATTTNNDDIKNAPVFLTITRTLFDSLAEKAVLPFLDGITKNMSIPAIKVHNKTLTLDLDAFSADLDLSSIYFNLSLPANVQMHLKGIKLHSHEAGKSTSTPINFKLSDIITCKGTMQPENDGAGLATIDIPLIAANKTTKGNNGTQEMVLSVGEVTFPQFNLGDLALNVKTPGLWNLACDAAMKTIEKIAKKSLGQILSFIIQKELPAIAKLLTDELQKVFANLPLTAAPKADPTLHGITFAADLTDLLNISTSTSSSNEGGRGGGGGGGDSFTASAAAAAAHHHQSPSLLLRGLLLRTPPRLSSAPTPPRFIPDRDLSLALLDSSVNALLFKFGPNLNALLSKWTLGENLTTSFLRPYIPLVYERCKDCPLIFSTDVFDSKTETSSLSVSFEKENLTTSIQGATWIVQANDTSAAAAVEAAAGDNIKKWSLVDLFSFTVDAAGSFDNFKIVQIKKKNLVHFELNLDQIAMKTKTTNVGPLQPEVIAWLLNSLLKTTLLPIINDILYLPVPGAIDIKIGNFSISHMKTEMLNGMIVVGSEVKF